MTPVIEASCEQGAKMRNAIATGLAAGMLIVAAGAVQAAAAPLQATTPAPKSQAKTSHSTSHATTGVVKSIDANTLVITRSDKQHHEMTFQIDSSTHKDGKVEAGAPVSVRYHEKSGAHIATAI